MKISKKLAASGLAASVLLVGSSAFAWHSYTKNIQARFAQIKLIVDGKTIQTKAEPFIYNGNVYAPIATIANALGVDQYWDNKTPAVIVKDKEYEKSEYVPTMSDRVAEEEASWTHTTVIGDNISLTIFNPPDYPSTSVYRLKDEKNNINVTLPAITKDGYYNKQVLLTQGFTNITGNDNHEFVVEEGLQNNDTNESETWVSVYRYEDKKVEKVSSAMVDIHTRIKYTGGDPWIINGQPELKFDQYTKSLEVSIYDMKSSNHKWDKDLISVKQYKFVDGELKLVKEFK